MVNVQKRLKGASAEANFWHGEYIDHAEIEVVKSENMIFCHFSQFLLKEFKKNSMS